MKDGELGICERLLATVALIIADATKITNLNNNMEILI